jgi:hypothetical protein
MRFKLATLLLLGATGMAHANPQETLTFTDVPSDGLENAATNSVRTAVVAGTYGVSKIVINAVLNSGGTGTYGYESVLKITPPGGTPFYVEVSGIEDVFTTQTYTNLEVYLPTPVANAAGTWEVRFFETFNDAGIDSTWATMSITLDDEAPGFVEATDAGDTLVTAMVPSGSGPLTSIYGSLNGDDDVYKIEICDAANFAASTTFSSFVDTRLFLFDANGMGVAFNDDYFPNTQDYYYQSRLQNFPVTAGTYYVGVSAFERMARTAAGDAIWNTQPYDTVRAPDGPGATGTLDNWGGTTDQAGPYVLSLKGACYATSTPTCGDQDFNGDGDFGTDQDIEAFFACLGGQCCATCYVGGSDFNGDGDFGTDQDIESFFRVLSGGPC